MALAPALQPGQVGQGQAGGGEIAAQIQERAFDSLDAPVGRVGSEFTPVGFSRILERAILPSTEKVLEAARKVLAY